MLVVFIFECCVACFYTWQFCWLFLYLNIVLVVLYLNVVFVVSIFYYCVGCFFLFDFCVFLYLTISFLLNIVYVYYLVS